MSLKLISLFHECNISLRKDNIFPKFIYEPRRHKIGWYIAVPTYCYAYASFHFLFIIAVRLSIQLNPLFNWIYLNSNQIMYYKPIIPSSCGIVILWLIVDCCTVGKVISRRTSAMLCLRSRYLMSISLPKRIE